MEGLKRIDTQAYAAQMQGECRRLMELVAEAVNEAPTGNVISGSEMQVRDLLAEFRKRAFETAVQMRVDSTESTFSPCEGCGGQAPGKQGSLQSQHDDGQRADQLVAAALVGRGRGKRLSGRPAAR